MAIIAIILIILSAGRWSTGPASGGPVLPLTAAREVPTTRPARLRLATFNIHSGVGLDNRTDLARTARLLEPFDLVALQEVAGSGPAGTDEATELAARLGVAGLFSPTERHFGMAAFGNGVLTRTRIDCWWRTPLPNGFHMAHRQMLRLSVPFGGRTLNVLVVHMGKKSDRRRQFETVTAAFKAMPEPSVLMGDLNTRPEDDMIKALLAGTDARDTVGEHTPPVDRVDFILTRGLRCVDAGLIKNDASDHPVAWAELELDQ